MQVTNAVAPRVSFSGFEFNQERYRENSDLVRFVDLCRLCACGKRNRFESRSSTGGRIDVEDKIAAPRVDKGTAAHQLAGLLDLLNFLPDRLLERLHLGLAGDAVEGHDGHVKSHDEYLLDDW